MCFLVILFLSIQVYADDDIVIYGEQGENINILNNRDEDLSLDSNDFNDCTLVNVSDFKEDEDNLDKNELENTSIKYAFATKNRVYKGERVFATNSGDVLRVKYKNDNWVYVLNPVTKERIISIPMSDIRIIKNIQDVKDYKHRELKNLKVNKVISFLYNQLGKPYVYGATGPYTYDCSGLTGRAFKTIGINLPRVALSQSFVGANVPLNNLRIGDLLYFKNGVQGHTGVYIGGNKMIHAPEPGDFVKIAPINSVSGFIRARRHIN